MIQSSAIRKNDVVYTGLNHADIMHHRSRPLGFLKHGEQGFLTTDGKFVNRIEAGKIALESGQIKELKWSPNLYSEDLLNEYGEYNYESGSIKDDVMTLRNLTGCGMAQAKRAFQEVGTIDKAIRLLRFEGLAVNQGITRKEYIKVLLEEG